MRVIKEVLVLAVIVLVFAFAARQLEGFDAGKIETDVPPLLESLKQIVGWDEKAGETPPMQETPSK